MIDNSTVFGLQVATYYFYTYNFIARVYVTELYLNSPSDFVEICVLCSKGFENCLDPQLNLVGGAVIGQNNVCQAR